MLFISILHMRIDDGRLISPQFRKELVVTATGSELAADQEILHIALFSMLTPDDSHACPGAIHSEATKKVAHRPSEHVRLSTSRGVAVPTIRSKSRCATH